MGFRIPQSNRTHIVISITFVLVECVVVSSYRSRAVVESQLWYRLISAVFLSVERLTQKLIFLQTTRPTSSGCCLHLIIFFHNRFLIFSSSVKFSAHRLQRVIFAIPFHLGLCRQLQCLALTLWRIFFRSSRQQAAVCAIDEASSL